MCGHTAKERALPIAAKQIYPTRLESPVAIITRSEKRETGKRNSECMLFQRVVITDSFRVVPREEWGQARATWTR